MHTIYRSLTLIIAISFLSYEAYTQVAKTIIVEHFTNSRCGICTGRNPGFYENFNKQDDALHVSYHPSRPYSSCVLHKHNAEENDSRTKFYRVYGSTPRLVIQGEVVSGSTDYSNSSIFEKHSNQTSPLSITTEQFKLDDDNIQIQITVTNEMMHDLTDVRLLAGVAESVVNYDAPNGEKQHFDVFRKAYTLIEGDSIRLEKAQGAVQTLQYSIPINEEWDLDELFSYVILQEEDTKAVVQSDATASGKFSTPVSVANNIFSSINAFPNPVQDVLYVDFPVNEKITLQLFDSNGKNVKQQSFHQQAALKVDDLSNGLYIANIQHEGKNTYFKIIVQ